MAIENINRGAFPDDPSADTLWAGAGKINSNFDAVSDNIDIKKSLFLIGGISQVLATINSLNPYTVNEKQSVWFSASTPNTSGGLSFTYDTYKYKMLNKGAGTYGAGATQLGPSDIELIYKSVTTAADIINEETQSFDYDTLAPGQTIEDYLNAQNPPLNLQEQEEGTVVFLGANGTYWFIGAGGLYGVGANQATNDAFILIPDEPQNDPVTLDEALGNGNISNKKMILTQGTQKTEYTGAGLTNQRNDFLTTIEFLVNTLNVKYSIPAKPTNDVFAMVSDLLELLELLVPYVGADQNVQLGSNYFQTSLQAGLSLLETINGFFGLVVRDTNSGGAGYFKALAVNKDQITFTGLEGVDDSYSSNIRFIRRVIQFEVEKLRYQNPPELTDDNDIPHKKYVDDAVAGGGGTLQGITDVLNVNNIASNNLVFNNTQILFEITGQNYGSLAVYSLGIKLLAATGKRVEIIGTGIILDSIAPITATNTIEYQGDYSSTFTERSLTDKGYVDSLVVGVYRGVGNHDASTGLFPTVGSGPSGGIRRGDTFKVSVAGTLGSQPYDVGDSFYAVIANPGQVDANWARYDYNTQQASEIMRGTVFFATVAEQLAGLINNKAATPQGVAAILSAQITDYPETAYAQTPVWTGTTPPSGTMTAHYSATKTGKRVEGTINLNYSAGGVSLTGVTLPFPTGLPAPAIPTGRTGSTDWIYPAVGYLFSSPAGGGNSRRVFAAIRKNASGFELFISQETAGALSGTDITFSYRTA